MVAALPAGHALAARPAPRTLAWGYGGGTFILYRRPLGPPLDAIIGCKRGRYSPLSARRRRACWRPSASWLRPRRHPGAAIDAAAQGARLVYRALDREFRLVAPLNLAYRPGELGRGAALYRAGPADAPRSSA